MHDDRKRVLEIQGAALRAWREAKLGPDGGKLSQEDAAAMISVSQGAWTGWERGTRAPDAHCAGLIERLTRGRMQVLAKGWAFPRSSSLAARHTAEAAEVGDATGPQAVVAADVKAG